MYYDERDDEAVTVPAGVMTMIRRNLPWAARNEAIASQGEEAERLLAPVLQVMGEAGLIDAGFKAALSGHITAADWGSRDVSSATAERLARARDLIRDRVDLLAVPDALIGLNHAVMPLLGDPVAGSVGSWEQIQGGVELC